MKTAKPSTTLPLIGILIGVTCLGASSFYGLTAPGLSFVMGAESRLTEACQQTAGCTQFVARRDQTNPASPGVQVTFVMEGKAGASARASLRTAVDDVVTRPSAVTVGYAPANNQSRK